VNAPRFYVILVLFLALGSQWSCNSLKAKKDDGAQHGNLSSALVVKTLPVLRKDWIVATPISGELHTLSTVEIKPEVGGRLIAIHFQEGDMVRKDQLLAEIDQENYRLVYDQAAAALAVAEAGLDRVKVSADHARTEKDRADNLLQSGGITQKDHQAAVTGVKEAESQVRLAEAQCKQARAALAIGEKALKDCKIFAPDAGQVQKKFFDKGSMIAPGVVLCILVDNSRLELECVIPAYQLASIRLGQRAVFTTPTWADRRFEGIVSAINPTIESENRSVKLKLRIANSGGELRGGMYARGEIVTGHESQALVIPRDSLIPEKEGSDAASVYVVKEGKARSVNIQIGGSQQESVWVRKGLSEGELVIIEIGPSLKDGIPVRTQPNAEVLGVRP
jgi:RND family efflux transporter MFP subunit